MFTKILKNNNALTISDDLFSEVMVRNNRRLFLSFFSILLLANLATIAIKAAGRGSVTSPIPQRMMREATSGLASVNALTRRLISGKR